MMPHAIPFEIEYAKGITMIVMNAGIPSVGSVKSIPVTDFIIRYPTKIRAGAVAAAGMIANTSLKTSARRKKIEVTREERPVRPPASTPEELSTNEVTVDVPRHAPVTVPTASQRMAHFALTMFPS